MNNDDLELEGLIERAASRRPDDLDNALEAARGITQLLGAQVLRREYEDLVRNTDSDEEAWRTLLRRLQHNRLAIGTAQNAIAEYRLRFPPTAHRGAETLYIKALLNAGLLPEAVSEIEHLDATGNWATQRLDEAARACPRDRRGELSQMLQHAGIQYVPDADRQSTDFGMAAARITARTSWDDPVWSETAVLIPDTLANLRAGSIHPDSALVTALVRVLSRTDPEHLVSLLEDPENSLWPQPTPSAIREFIACVGRQFGYADASPLELVLRLDALGFVNSRHLREIVSENKLAGSSPLCNWALGRLAPSLDPEGLKGATGNDARIRRFFNLFIEGPHHPATQDLALEALALHGPVVLQVMTVNRLRQLVQSLLDLPAPKLKSVLSNEPFLRPRKWRLGSRFTALLLASCVGSGQATEVEHAIAEWGASTNPDALVLPIAEATAEYARRAYTNAIADQVQQSPLVETLLERRRGPRVPEPKSIPFGVASNLGEVILTEAQLLCGDFGGMDLESLLTLLAFDFPSRGGYDAQSWRDGLDIADTRPLRELLSAFTPPEPPSSSALKTMRLFARALPAGLLTSWLETVHGSAGQDNKKSYMERRRDGFNALKKTMHPRGSHFGLLSGDPALSAARKLRVLNSYADVLKRGYRSEIELCLRYARDDLHQTANTYFLLECYFAATKKEYRLEDWELQVGRYLADPDHHSPRRRMSAGLWAALVVGGIALGVDQGQEVLFEAVTELTHSTLSEAERQFSVGELARLLMTMPRTAPYIRAESQWLSIAKSEEMADGHQRLARFLEILGIAHVQANRSYLVQGEGARSYCITMTWAAAFGESVPEPVARVWRPLSDGADQAFDQALSDDVFHRVATLSSAVSRLLRHDLQGILNPARAVVEALELGKDEIAIRNARAATKRASEMVALLDLILADRGETSTNIRTALREAGIESGEVEWFAPPNILLRLPTSITTYALHELVKNVHNHVGRNAAIGAVVGYDPSAGTFGSVSVMIVDSGPGIHRNAVDDRGWITPVDNPDLKDDRALTTLNHALIAAGGRLLAQERNGRLFPTIKGPASKPRSPEERRLTNEQ